MLRGRPRAGLGWLAAFGAAGLAALTTMAVFARDWWLADQVHVFRVHLFAGSAVVLLMALAARRWATAAVAVVLALANAVFLESLVAAPGRPATAADGTAARVTVATINVLASNADHESLVELVRADPPDVLVLHEALGIWRPALLQLEPLYPYGLPRRWTDGYWLIVLSRLPILEAGMSHHAGTGWPWAVLRLDGPAGPFSLVALHPPPPRGEDNWLSRRSYLMAVAEAAAGADRPLAIAGDFNAVPWTPDQVDFAERVGGIRDAARGRGWMPTWPAQLGWAGIPIDRIMVGEGIDATSLRVGPPIGSDHLPLFGEIAFPPPPADAR